jgi:O-antigen/teichoic acid export membrane protein
MKEQLQKIGLYLKENLFTNIGSGQTILKNSFWLLLADGTSKGIMFLVNILIARHYTTGEYGIFGYVFSVMTLIALMADFGLVNITIRELAKNRDRADSFFEDAITLKLLLTVFAFLCMVATTFFLGTDIRLLAILAGMAILLEGMTDYLRVSFRLSEHAQYEVVIKVAGAAMVIVLVAACLVLGLSLAYIVLGFCIAHLCNLLLSLRLIDLKMPRRINRRFVRKLFVESWPVFLGLACTVAYGQVDLVLIKIYRGFAAVGLYQAAYKLLFGFQLFRVVHLAMFPRLASFYAAGNILEYRKLVRSCIALSVPALIPIGIVAALFPVDIIRLIFGQHYVGASVALPFLIWGGIVSFINTFFSNTLIVSGHQKGWLILEVTALVFLILIEVALIPRIGFYGAAIATFAGEVLFFGLILLSVYSNKKLRIIFF